MMDDKLFINIIKNYIGSVSYNKYKIGSWFHNNKNKIKKETDDIYIKLSIKLSENEHIKKYLDNYLKNKNEKPIIIV